MAPTTTGTDCYGMKYSRFHMSIRTVKLLKLAQCMRLPNLHIQAVMLPLAQLVRAKTKALLNPVPMQPHLLRRFSKNCGRRHL